MRTSTTRRASASSDSHDVGVGARDASLRDLGRRQRAEQAQQVSHPFGVACLPVRGEALQLTLDLGEHVGVEQLPQLGATEQLGEQPLVEGECGRAALGDRASRLRT